MSTVAGTVPVGASDSALDHIAVCVCTYRRPQLLDRLLVHLSEQVTHDQFSFEVVVVENDAEQQCAALVSRNAKSSAVPMKYACEPERNIAHARNRAIATADGNLVAFIDDDEVPLQDWLLRLYRTLEETGADGVLGPVIPDLPPEAPSWLRRGRICERPRHPTGTVIGRRDGRTGNALIRRSLVDDGLPWFDPAFGRTGGEDSDFFMRHRAAGRRFVWCDEAVVKEVVPADRWTAGFQLRRMWRSGTISGTRVRNATLPNSFMLRNAMVLCLCLVVAPLTVVVPKHVRMRVAMKAAYCGGVVSAALGWSSTRSRE